MTFIIREYKHLIILNISSIAFFFVIFYNLKTPINEEIMFATPDSNTYKSVSDWLIYGIETDQTRIRPILYPLFISIKEILGVFGIWLLHFIFWIASINFIFISVFRVTKRYILAYFSSIIILLNLSYIAIIFHALTEVTTVFFLSLLLHFITKFILIKNYSNAIKILFIVGLLTILKPLFFPIWLGLVLILIPTFFLKRENIKSLFKTSLFLIVLLPVFLQLGLMKLKHNTIGISQISGITFTNYLLAQTIQKVQDIPQEESIRLANSLNSTEKLDWVLNHKKEVLVVYFDNLFYNIKTFPAYLQYPQGYEQPTFAKIMRISNTIYFIIHCLFFIPVFLAIYLSIKKKQSKEHLLLISLAVLIYWIIFTSGISRNEGDRLVLPALPLWVFLYSYTIYYFFLKAHDEKKLLRNP